MNNQELLERYPFLQPRNYFDDEIVDTESTWLDQMPNGWRKAFGEQMVEEISNILKKVDYERDYRIVQIKEKWGGLRWYDNGAPAEIYDELHDCINKYEEMSYTICIECGVPADGQTRGWINPLCNACADKRGTKLIPFKE